MTVPSLTSTEASFWTPATAIARLSALGEALADPTSTVGPAGLASPVWTTSRPAHAALFVRSEATRIRRLRQHGCPGPVAAMDAARWPRESPGTFGSTFAGPHGPEQCTFLPTADAWRHPGRARWTRAESRRKRARRRSRHSPCRGALWGADTVTAIFSLEMAALLPEDAGVTCLEAYSY